jgi:Uma2 family endonuclease
MSAAAIVLELPVRTQTSVQTPVQRKVWTYEDYLNLPDDGRRYEIIEGVLYVSNAPDIEHQFAVSELLLQLGLFAKQQQLGYVLTAPFEVHLSQRTRPVQPDVLFIRKEQWPKTAVKYFEGAPALVVEVLSSSTRRVDQTIKFTAYEQAKVPEYWIVDPKTRFVQVFTLNENQEYDLLGEFLGEELIESKVLVGLRIVTESLFMVHG